MAPLNNSPSGHLNSCYIHLEFSFASKVMYATAGQAMYLDQSESKDEQMWLKDAFNYESFVPGYIGCLQNCLIVLIIITSARILYSLNFPATHCAWSQAKKLHKHHLTWRWFIPTEQMKYKGRQLNELSFMNLCMIYIYHMTFHIKLSQCLSKILQYH